MPTKTILSDGSLTAVIELLHHHLHTHTHTPPQSAANNSKFILQKTFLCSFIRSTVSSMNDYLMFNSTGKQQINSKVMLHKTFQNSA